MRSASSLVRPLTQATSEYLAARRSTSARVAWGTWASSGRSTIGARTPSTSSSTAARCGSSTKGRSRSFTGPGYGVALAGSRMLRKMTRRLDEVWIPLVDEPIGGIVARIQEDHPDIDRLVSSPQRLLAFRTFAYIRVGLLLGQLLVDDDLDPYDGSETWIDALLRDPRHRAEVEREVRAVAEELAADPAYDEDEIGPDENVRERFREFARRRLEAS